MVFAGLYPVDASKFEELRATLEKFQLNDASFVYEPESSLALGFGFRCGFLGLLHLEIVQERLFREFNMDVITTVPNVSYKVYTTKGEVIDVHNPSGLPPQTLIDHIEEPYIRAQIISKSDFYGPIMKLCMDKRGTLIGQHYITTDRVELNYDLPLSEVVFDFYDKLKSISKGYASFDYHVTDFRPARLVKLDILLNGDPADALSTLVVSERPTQRYFLFREEDSGLWLVGWTNVATGEVRTPFPDLDVAACRRLAFAGIHLVSPQIFEAFRTLGFAPAAVPTAPVPDSSAPAAPLIFSITDFYLAACARYPIYGVVPPDFRMMDVGKVDTLAAAETFLAGLDENRKM
jgi:hypothetical protein